MSPSARLIGYYIDNNERIVADSILLNVEDSLPTKVSVALFPLWLIFLSTILRGSGVFLDEQALNIFFRFLIANFGAILLGTLSQ